MPLARKPTAISPESFRCRLVIPSARNVSSRDVGWTSLLIELHTGVSSSEPYTSIATPDQIVGVAMSGRYASEFFYGGRWRRGVYEPGSICIHRRGESARYRFDKHEHGEAETALLYLPHTQLAAAADQLRRPGQRLVDSPLGPVADRDPAIFQMATALLQAVEQGADDLYAETAAAWLAVHVLSKHSNYLTLDGNRKSDHLTDPRLARVIEFMSTHFAKQLTLDELAAHANVSKYHFTRLFKSKVGRTPHSFLTEIRLDTARRMLVTTALPIAEVGLACGYRSASHLSAAFAARFGVAPTTFRIRHKSST